MVILRLTVHSAQAERLLRAAPSRLHAAIVRGLRRGSEVVVKRAQANIRANRSWASGALAGSIFYRLDATGSNIGPGLRRKATATQREIDYGWFVEHGRKPGKWPPRGVLRQWIRDKLGEKPTGRLDFLIRRAIGRKGTKPAPFLEPALRESEPAVRAVFADQIAQEVRKLDAGV